MSQLATQQLDSIHAMLSAGHRNLRIERHSLILWGICGGCLIFISKHILTADQFPDLTQRALAWLIFLAITLSGVSLLDWHLMHRAKQARDETWSFIHKQVLKVWWLLILIGVLLTFATFFYGGGYMIMGAWVVLIGLGLYIHGLFSEELLEWTGALIIAIGISMLLFRLSYPDLRLVATSTLALGLPLLAAMLDRGLQRAPWVRLLQSGGWLLCVLIPPLLAHQLVSADAPPEAPVVSLDEFRKQPATRQVVIFPAGSSIPVKVEISGNMFRTGSTSMLPLILNEPVEVMMDSGQPTGDWRFPGENWMLARETHWISIPWLKAELNSQSGPEISTSLVFEPKPHPSH